MSGIKPLELTEFYRRLHSRRAPSGRRMDTFVLADLSGMSRPTVTRILNGSRRRGPSWPKIARHLTPEELALLDVAHFSTWNTQRAARRSRWTAEKAGILGPAEEAVNA